MNIESITFNELPSEEGLVFLGAGGSLQEWIDGTAKDLIEEGIAAKFPWEKAFKLTTTGGRTDLLLTWKSGVFDIGKLAMWRLRFGDVSWRSDYEVNYRGHHFIG